MYFAINDSDYRDNTGSYTIEITPINQSSVQPAKSFKPISKTITVPSTDMWYDTGVDIANGKTVKIEYRSGHWTNFRGTPFTDGGGKQFERRHLLIVPGSDLACLVGKVGTNSFHIGNYFNGKPGAGRLYLSINDVPKTYNDNEGELDVLVEVK